MPVLRAQLSFETCEHRAATIQSRRQHPATRPPTCSLRAEAESAGAAVGTSQPARAPCEHVLPRPACGRFGNITCGWTRLPPGSGDCRGSRTTWLFQGGVPLLPTVAANLQGAPSSPTAPSSGLLLNSAASVGRGALRPGVSPASPERFLRVACSASPFHAADVCAGLFQRLAGTLLSAQCTVPTEHSPVQTNVPGALLSFLGLACQFS